MSGTGDTDFDVAEFAHAIVCVETNGVWMELVPGVDMVGSEQVEGWRRAIAADVIHVISACNPGHRAPDAVNVHQHEQLGERLRDDGHLPMAALGMSPDRRWVEPSWAVSGLDRYQACAYGSIFAQVAVFEIDATCIRVIDCARGEEWSVRPYSCAVVSVE